MPIRNNEIHCVKCNEKIDPPHIVRYKGEDFHKRCFIEETETPDIKKNPTINMNLSPRAVKTMLEAMESYLGYASVASVAPVIKADVDPEENHAADIPDPDQAPITVTDSGNSDLYAEVKQLYPNIALRLSQAGRGIGQCANCGRARYYESMISGGKSRGKTVEALTYLSALVADSELKKKINEECARILLFCDENCDQIFSERPANERLKNFSAIKERVRVVKEKKQAKADEKKELAVQEREKAAKPRVEKCVECGHQHADFRCEDCGAWLGRGTCPLHHYEKHEQAEEAEVVAELEETLEEEFAQREVEIKERLREYEAGDLQKLLKSASIPAVLNSERPVIFDGVEMTSTEWQQLLKEVLESKRMGSV